MNDPNLFAQVFRQMVTDNGGDWGRMILGIAMDAVVFMFMVLLTASFFRKHLKMTVRHSSYTAAGIAVVACFVYMVNIRNSLLRLSHWGILGLTGLLFTATLLLPLVFANDRRAIFKFMVSRLKMFGR